MGVEFCKVVKPPPPPTIVKQEVEEEYWVSKPQGLFAWAWGFEAEKEKRTRTKTISVTCNYDSPRKDTKTDTTSARAVGPFILGIIKSRKDKFILQLASQASCFELRLPFSEIKAPHGSAIFLANSSTDSSFVLERDTLRPTRLLLRIPAGTSATCLRCSQEMNVSITFPRLEGMLYHP
jgi:hypothetical protein